jgi:ribosomal protein S18 acetylase RimI-like enzyme
VLIRPATHDDIARVLDCWHRAEAAQSTTDDPDSLGRLLDRDAESLLLAVLDGEVVGTLVVGWDGWRGAMYRLAVLPEWRRRGVARELVSEGERRLRELGARRIGAVVISEHDPAVEFWRALGYERNDRVDRFVKTLVSER